MKFKTGKRMLAALLALVIAVSMINVPAVKAAETSQEVNVDDVLSQEAVGDVLSQDLASKDHRAVYTFLIDPGHGQDQGTDCGAIYTHNGVTQYERDINFKIATYLKAELEKYPNVKVYMTRYGRVSDFEEFEVMARYAAGLNADALISIHNNAASDTDVNGAMVLVPNKNYDKQVYQEANGLGRCILNQLVKLGLANKGLYQRLTEKNLRYPDGSLADYYAVVKQAKLNHLPGIIIEHAFGTNYSDFTKYLSTDAKLKALAQADARGIIEYYGLDKFAQSTGAVTVNRGIDYSDVYDFDYYVNKYDDIKKEYGNDPIGALMHFTRYGMKEGRQAKADFIVADYKNGNADLRKAYGDDLKKYYQHYVQFGKGEGRSGVGGWTAKSTMYNGVDYSAVYDYNYYVSHNKDVKSAFGTNYEKVLWHFVTYGMREGRRGNAAFDPKSYRKQYRDLRQAYGDDWTKYYYHYINTGRREGRKATGVKTLQNAVTVYNGIDYSAVYDYNFYYNKYPDLQKAFGLNDTKMLQHFVQYGMREGRQAKATFDVVSYKNAYADLRSAFGNNTALYYIHYVKYGYNERRVATGVNKIVDYPTIYAGIDYSAVYDYNYYIKKYPDIKKAFGNDEMKALQHFATYGMREKRQAKSTFDVVSYRNLHQDLRIAYGFDYPSYYKHYIRYGKNEGRKATGAKTIRNPLTVYNGIDYSAVYDYDFYLNRYKDLQQAYGGYNDVAMIQHFATYGIKEWRKAKENFSMKTYKSLREKSSGTAGYYTIMGTSSITKDQMVKYYNAKAKYPDYYKKTDAPTLDAFCQIYIEECAAEGVKVEVAFAQMLLETGYLKYGGLVSIEDKNFAGMGATDSAAERNVAKFKTVREGVRAQVQHLKAYASTQPLKNAVVDPRFNLVTRGSAQYVEYLSIPNNPNKKGWASDKDYAVKIKSIIAAIKTY